MVNIWDYANYRPKIRLKGKRGEDYVGDVYMVWDAIETESEQDSITLELENGEFKSFYQDEIESIEVLYD